MALMSDALREIESLLLATAQGDQKAFVRLYDLTSAKLFGVCLRILKEKSASEDAVQEIYIKVWQNAPRYQVNGLSPMTWLITIARNHAIDRLRRARQRAEPMEAADLVADPTPGPEAAAVASGERARINDCLETLTPPRGQAVRAAYLNGDSYAELAERFDVPLNTMRTWLRRSLIALRKCLER